MSDEEINFDLIDLDRTHVKEVNKLFHKNNRVRVIGAINKWKKNPTVDNIEFHLHSDNGGKDFFNKLEIKMKEDGFIASVNTSHKMFYLALPSCTGAKIQAIK